MKLTKAQRNLIEAVIDGAELFAVHGERSYHLCLGDDNERRVRATTYDPIRFLFGRHGDMLKLRPELEIASVPTDVTVTNTGPGECPVVTIDGRSYRYHIADAKYHPVSKQRTPHSGPTLVREETGEPVHVGSVVTTFRGERAVIERINAPHKPSSTGSVDTDIGSHYPSVYGLAWVNRTDR